DGSPGLVAVATRRAAMAGHKIEYVCANASSLEPIPPESFDSVLASMVLMDVEDYQGAVDQLWRVLLPGGTLLMSITHPCFSAPTSEWVRTESGEPKYFAVHGYLERTVLDDYIIARFHRPDMHPHPTSYD